MCVNIPGRFSDVRMSIRGETGPPVSIFKISSCYFKKVISAFQSVIMLTRSMVPHLGLLQFRSV